MAKSQKTSLKNILFCVGIILLVLCFVMLALPGVSKKSDYGSSTVALAGLVFGNPTMKLTGSGVSISEKANGLLSWFGLISFILLLGAIILGVFAFVKKNKTIGIVAGIVAVIAGICIFMILVAGTTSKTTAYGITVETSFKETYEGCKLGIGTILYGILAILGGGLIAGSQFLK